MSEAWPDTYDEGIYTSISTWTHPQNSLAAAESRSLKISSHGTSPKWSCWVSQSVIKHSIPLQIWGKVNGNWDRNMSRISKAKAIVEKILASEEINKSERAGLWESNTLANGLIERTSPVLDETESKTVHKEEGDQ